MEFYKVGGFVRDTIMGIESKDVDWVVVGATEQEMIDQSFKKVGADFPVFLHPVSGDEYALARTERKSGNGYHGFEVVTENVTLADDLKRRDLTINAMAFDPQHNIIDPFNGEKDLADGVLRHVDADAFKEDPVRVLRVARFLARWPDFMVAKETKALCKEIVASGEMNHLTPERIWKETEKALSEEVPSRFFVFLRMVGALEIIFPEIHALIGQEQPYEHHPEGDAFVHTMEVLDIARIWSQDVVTTFCALAHDFGKGSTPKDMLPHHYGHEAAGIPLVKQMAERLKIPNVFRDHAILICKYHTHIHNIKNLNAKTIVKMFDELNFRKNHNILTMLPDVSYSDSCGRTAFYSQRPYPEREYAIEVLHNLSWVKISNIFSKEEIEKMSVDTIKNEVYKMKLKVVKDFQKERKS